MSKSATFKKKEGVKKKKHFCCITAKSRCDKALFWVFMFLLLIYFYNFKLVFLLKFLFISNSILLFSALRPHSHNFTAMRDWLSFSSACARSFVRSICCATLAFAGSLPLGLAVLWCACTMAWSVISGAYLLVICTPMNAHAFNRMTAATWIQCITIEKRKVWPLRATCLAVDWPLYAPSSVLRNTFYGFLLFIYAQLHSSSTRRTQIDFCSFNCSEDDSAKTLQTR